jgi:hypothetical protein
MEKPSDSATGISPELREVTVDKNILCISGKNGKSTCNMRLEFL